MVSYYNLGKPSTYSDCIELIAKYNYINQTTKEKLIGMTGLRNLLIHEYSTIDNEILYSLLENLNDISEFIKNLKRYIID